MSKTVARERELEAIEAFLDVDAPGGRALLLEGEAGIGKSVLWRAGTAMAAARGYRVLACTAAELEMQLAFTTLRDLLADAFDEIADGLPSPQRHALGVALLREEPTVRPAQPATAAVGFLSALRSLAARAPTLLAVDDVQWVDAASAAVLQYALRRLDAARVNVLLAYRVADGTGPSMRETLGRLDGLRVLEVGPFSLGALGRLLHERFGMAFPRPAVRRVHAASGGNAFYALEIARLLGERTSPLRAGEPLPVPGDLLQLVKRRLALLPAGTLDALAVASALARPTLDPVSVLGSEAMSLLEPAIEAEIVQTDGREVWFAHPLFATSVYALAAARRPAIHARLADVVVDLEERAHHLALATGEPNEDVARVVAAGAETAFGRGAPSAAAVLAAQARRLTPADEHEMLWGRALTEAEYAFAAGDTAHAAGLLDELARSTEPGAGRARVLRSQARVRHFERDIGASVMLLKRALEEVGDDAALRGEIEEGLAWGLLLLRTDLHAASRHARSACSLAEQRGDPCALAEGLAVTGLIDFFLGRDWERTMGRALSLEGSTLELSVLRHPSFAYGYCVTCVDELDRARGLFEELMQRTAQAGDESSVPAILNHLTLIECLAGRWEHASALADECHERALESGQQLTQHSILAKRALLAAWRGAVDEARENAWQALAPIGGRHFQPARTEEVMANGVSAAVAALGFIELMLGNAAEADRLLGPFHAGLIAAGIQEPGEMRWLPDEIEALVALGRFHEADALLTRLEGWAERLRRRSALGAAARCRGLLLAAEDDLGAALAALDEAVAWYEGVPLPFERGRALLARGTVQRRLRRRRAARETLSDALAVFEGLGAALCAEHARAELSRIGGRPASAHTLTPSERRIAELVAEGKTNKEVAAVLVVTDRTVESALTQIYRKLDVRSRTELARELALRA